MFDQKTFSKCHTRFRQKNIFSREGSKARLKTQNRLQNQISAPKCDGLASRAIVAGTNAIAPA